jgi:hypothetical protein
MPNMLLLLVGEAERASLSCEEETGFMRDYARLLGLIRALIWISVGVVLAVVIIVYAIRHLVR